MDFGGLKVLMISTDRNIFTPDSAVSERMKEYGKLAEELHIVVLCDKSHGLKDFQLGKNIWAYPTNTSTKYFRPLSAAKIGKRIVFDKKFVRGQSVITAQDPFECGWAGLKIKKKWRLPLEVQLHTDPFSPYFSGTLNSFRKYISKKALRQADSIRVVSESLKNKIGEHLKTENLNLKINVLPIYVDKELIEAMPVSFDLRARFGWQFTLLAVSRLTKEKDISTAIKALAEVRQKFPRTGLVIVGSGPEESKLKALAASLGIGDNVAFEGWQESLGSYYKTASLFIQTSLFEGYGMSLVEAGLSGLPVVSTPVGLAAELDDGKDLYLCPPGNADYFAGAIIDILENNQKRENLRINMKRALESKLITKEDYLQKIKAGWQNISKKVKV